MKTYSYAYSPLYTPVAPVVEIEVSSDRPGTADIRLTALLDSGADATMLPVEVLTRIGARYVESLYMLGVAGTRMPVDLFHVTVRVGPHSVPAIRAVALNTGGEAILGRDVLNHLVVTLDGPAGTAEIAG